MTSKTQKAIAALGSMRLPELQARYLDVIGSATRCPNRTYLIRKISEALTSKAGKAPSPSSTAPTPELHRNGTTRTPSIELTVLTAKEQILMPPMAISRAS